MNIFFLHRDPSRAAKAQCDKHVVKMVLETTQMLSTAIRRRGYDAGYKSAYPNHPMTIWVGDTRDNFYWALCHAEELSKEYTVRYKKFHACQQVIDAIRELYPSLSSFKNITDPPQCMPDYCKGDDAVSAYQNYYILEKSDFATWKHRDKPEWFHEKEKSYLEQI